MKCKYCGRDMELIGSGPGITVWECKKEDCGKGYKEVMKQEEENGRV